MHEQSETIKGRDGRWYNVYGAGAPQPMPLPKVFGFEESNYATPEEAVNKAAWRSTMGHGQYPTEAPSYGITNKYQPSPQAKALGTVIEGLMDPRTQMMTGTGMLPAIVKAPGWGAEALRRYKLMGGTPETLRRTLGQRGVDQEMRGEIANQFRMATDLAAPNADSDLIPWLTASHLQDTSMRNAGDLYDTFSPGLRTINNSKRGYFPQLPLHKAPKTGFTESGAKGQAAYGAVSRQVARMLDTPGFQFSRAEALPPVSGKEYYKAFPLDRDNPDAFWWQDEIARRQADARQ
jgi:hypothetical protein